MKAKYLSLSRVNAKIKHTGLQLAQYKTTGGNYFGFLDLDGNYQEGIGSIWVHRIHHFSLEQWVASAELAKEEWDIYKEERKRS